MRDTWIGRLPSQQESKQTTVTDDSDEREDDVNTWLKIKVEASGLERHDMIQLTAPKP